MHHDHRIRVLGIIILTAIIVVFNFASVPQDPAYHRFADRRLIAGLPNFYNVISNLPYLLIGFIGMRLLVTQPPVGGLTDLRWIYFTFFVGVFLTGIGASYYHLYPDNRTLVWDRLPMILTPVILWLFKSGLGGNLFYWGMIAAYALAKAAEYFDAGLYELVGAVSGHTLKHLLAAVAPYLFYRALRQREKIIRAV